MWELERELLAENKYTTDLESFKKASVQKRHDSHKINSLHELQVQCISKGKQHKKFEFGTKVSIMSTKTTGVIIRRIYF